MINGFLKYLISYFLPAFVALAAIPFLQKKYPADEFGFLTLVWVFFSLSAAFDFGFSRVIARLYHKEGARRDFLMYAFFYQSIVSIIAGVVVFCGLYFFGFVEKFGCFFSLWAGVIYVTLGFWGSGVFSVWRYIKEISGFVGVSAVSAGVLNSFPYVLPVFGYFLDYSIVFSLFLVLLIRCVFVSFVVHRSCTGQNFNFNSARLFLNEILSPGGWNSIYSFFALATSYIDRVIVSNFFPANLIANYNIAFDVVSRINLIPAIFVRLGMADFDKSLSAGDYSLVNKWLTCAFFYSLILQSSALFIYLPLRLWVGDEFANSVEPFVIVFIMAASYSGYNYIFYSSSVGLGVFKEIAFIQLFLFFVFVFALSYFGVKNNLYFCAIAVLVRAIFELVITYICVFRRKIMLANSLQMIVLFVITFLIMVNV